MERHVWPRGLVVLLAACFALLGTLSCSAGPEVDARAMRAYDSAVNAEFLAICEASPDAHLVLVDYATLVAAAPFSPAERDERLARVARVQAVLPVRGPDELARRQRSVESFRFWLRTLEAGQ